MIDSQLRALVAEDEPAMLSLVARHLRGLGFHVVEASEGDQAWELAQRHKPDLVILDVMMPGMSGWEICKRLKSHGANGGFQSTGVIMLTGIGENLNDMTSPLFAADAWLNKPFEFGELDERIRETLARYEKELPEPEELEEPEPPSTIPASEPELPRAAKPKAAAKPAAKPAKKRVKAAAARKPARTTSKAKASAKSKKPARAKAKPAARKAAKKTSAKKPAKKTAKKKTRR